MVAGIERWGLNRRGLTALCLILLLAWAIAGCGSGDGDTVEASTPARTPEPTKEPPKEGVDYNKIYRAESADLGRILFNEYGFTLYRFFKDKGSTPSCYGACAQQWPPYLAVGELKARKLKVFHHLGTTKRKDGALQVTYFGHPLYTFTGDNHTGDTDGNEVHAFGGVWYALHPNGHKAQGGGAQ